MKRYMFLDGSFIDVSDDTCRGCYLEAAKDVPVEVETIWNNEFFAIRQDAECPVPGFYIVSTRQHIHMIGDLPLNQAMQFGIIIHRLRICMAKYLKIERAHLILEEKMIEPHLHVWLLPLWKDVMCDKNIDPKVWNSNILEYLQLFSYDENKEKIRRFNDLMREKLSEDATLKRLKEEFVI